MTHAVQCPACGTEQPLDAPPGPCPACTRAEELRRARRPAQVAPPSPAPSPASHSEETSASLVPVAASPLCETENLSFPGHHRADFAPHGTLEGTAGGSTDVRPCIAGYSVIGPPRFGGMGVVWPAEQLGTRRPVALKLLGARQLTTAGRARFVREVELAARLQHPNIARVYESGVHERNYYYAMELVDGVPLDEYVTRNGLGQRQILELVCLVCAAVHHAHVRGVIHCDLKPSNILVTGDGQPHVLDFGLARLATGSPDGLTESGSAAGTPAYMSPEQAAGNLDHIDTRSDVYSLGNVAYRLLTGQPPHRLEGPLDEVLRRIAAEPVVAPSDARPSFDRELEALLLKSLHNDPERRYASAGELERDVRNFLAGEPLAAVGLSTRYVIRKRLFKHRLKVSAAASVLLVVALMAAAAYVRISRETTKARIIQDYLEYMLKTMDPRNSGGRDVTKELLDKANKELSARFAWEPAMEADIRETLGTNFLSLGHLAAAQDQFQRAVDLRRRAFGAADPQTLAATVNLARAYRERGNAKDAADLCRRAVAACEAALGADHRDTLRARIALAYALNDMSHNEEAEAPIREAWLRARGRWGDADDDTLACAAVLALVLRDLGGENDLNEAEALCQSTLKTRTEKYGPLHADTLESMHDLGTVLTLKGHYTDAEALYHSAIDAGAEILKRPSAPRDVARHNHPDLLVWRSDYAYVLRQLKRHAAAEEIYRQILPASVVARGPAHPYTIILRSNYAAVLVEQEKWAEAEYHCRQANALQDEHWGRDDPRTLTFRDMLAQILSARGQWEESIRIYRETLEIRRKRLPPGDPELLAAEKNVAMVTAFHRKWLDAQTADGAGAANQPAGSPD